jgi:hypothetical protein
LSQLVTKSDDLQINTFFAVMQKRKRVKPARAHIEPGTPRAWDDLLHLNMPGGVAPKKRS